LSHVDQPAPFAVEARPDRARVIVVVRGEVDVATVGEVQRVLDELRSEGWRDVVVDLRDVEFLDSTGLTLLLSADRAARRDGWDFSIVDGSKPVARLFELTGLTGHFRQAQLRP
jgi:anti-sigma B factor antagonist